MATVEMQRLAKAIAHDVEATVLAMLEGHELGEVAAVIGYNEVELEKRPRIRVRRWKVQLGDFSRVRAQT